MTLNEYQSQAESTAVYPGMKHPPKGEPTGDMVDQAIVYLALKLSGEAGEVGEKIAKVERDNNGIIDQPKRQELEKELGDVLWYVAMLSRELCLDLDDVAKINLAKLRDRQERGTLKGSGDNR
jgi:NTP pyrophosphatase (non-canonical NTP hydrolase)